MDQPTPPNNTSVSNTSSGAVATDGSVAAASGGTAIGRDVQGDVNVHNYSGPITIIQQIAATHQAARQTLTQSEAAATADYWDDIRRLQLDAAQKKLRTLLKRLSHYEQQASNKDPNNLPWELITNMEQSAEAVEQARQEVERLSTP